MIKDHAVPLTTYIAVFVGLVVLTYLTYKAAYWDLGSHSLNVILALAIAVTKATLVVLFFMHVKYAHDKITKVVIVAALFWLAILLALSMADYTTRLWT